MNSACSLGDPVITSGAVSRRQHCGQLGPAHAHGYPKHYHGVDNAGIQVPTPIPMNVWPTGPRYLRPADWRARVAAHTICVLSYRDLCCLAGILPRISGPDLGRRIHILRGKRNLCPAGVLDDLGVALPDYQGREWDALRVLETLAYGFMDYAAREAVRGRGFYLPWS